MNTPELRSNRRIYQAFLSFLTGMALILFLPAIIIAQSADVDLAGTKGFIRYPDIHADNVVFTSSGDLWLATVQGGHATRITSHEGEERFAHFSPDGKWIAFSGYYYGNEDVFVVSTAGGEPKQLTFHPSADEVTGWSGDGSIIFRSRREAPFFQWQLYTVDLSGGFPERLPFYRAAQVSFEPEGKRAAIVPTFLAFHPWKRYKGGWAEKIWVGDPAIPEFHLVRHTTGNERNPMWNRNGRIYFTSDSLGRADIWSTTPDGKKLQRETSLGKYDIRWCNMHNNRIIFQYGMNVGIFDVDSRKTELLDIAVPSDLYVARTKYINPSDYITSWSLSPNGRRLLVAARGEIFTLPVISSGLIRQWTYSSGSREKFPSFIPEADDAILTLSDATGEDQIHVLKKGGGVLEDVEKNPQPGWKLAPAVSPDGKWAAWSDYSFKLYVTDLKKGNTRQIDESGWEITEYVWSADGRYLAYCREESNLLSSLYIYDTKSSEHHLISDTRFSTHDPAWDPSGRYLYCVTDRNFNAYQDYNKGLFYYDHQSTLALYRLRKDVASPFIARGDAPEKDKLPEAVWMPGYKAEDDKKKKDDDDDKEDEWKPEPLEIDFDGLAERMEPIPEIPGNYGSLAAVNDKLYYIASERGGINSGRDIKDYKGPWLRLFDLQKRESKQLVEGIWGYQVSNDNKVIVVHKDGNWYHGEAGGDDLSLEDKNRVSTDDWQLEVTPRQEWRQILHEAWRLQRDFFYDPNMHGVDWAKILELYEPLIDRVTTRDDLRDLIREIQSELHAGHAYIGPGDERRPDNAPVGFLGASFRPDPKSGFYVFDKIYNPEPGTPQGVSPLVSSLATVNPGTYLLQVNGRQVKAAENIFRLFQDQAGKEVAITVNDKPSMKGSREVIIRTTGSEYQLRYLDWVKQKREYVLEKSGGKIGYVHLPDMGGSGLSQIGRDYYSQRTMPAMILDDRFNGGGNIAEYFLKILETDIWAIQQGRQGTIDMKPHGGYFGHIAALCNEETFSDGETFAEGIKRLKIGKLIGERTWGGWIWISARHPLMDNAFISEPEFGGWGLDGKWMIEGRGVEPDMEVVNDPASEIRGEDKQLDAAIEHLLAKLKEDPRTLPKRPAGKIVR